MLRFLTDENVAISVKKALRQAKFFVKDVKEEKMFGVSDSEIITLAKKERRVIITHDKDFLEYPQNLHRGVCLLRFSNQSPKNVIKHLLFFIKSRGKKLEDKITILNENWIKTF